MAAKLRTRLFVLVQTKETTLGRHLTNKEIAEGVGVSMHTVGRWMRGEVTQLNTKVLEGFCEYFNCDVGDLLYMDRSEAGG